MNVRVFHENMVMKKGGTTPFYMLVNIILLYISRKASHAGVVLCIIFYFAQVTTKSRTQYLVRQKNEAVAEAL